MKKITSTKIKFFFLFVALLFYSTIASYGAIYTVTVTANAGIGSFRQAVLDANTHLGADTINFNLGPGTSTITINAAFPAITGDSTYINGFDNGAYPGTPNTVPAYSVSPSAPVDASYRVFINYNLPASTGYFLSIASNYNTIKRSGAL